MFKYYIIVKQQLCRGMKMPAVGLLLLLMSFTETAIGRDEYLKIDAENAFEVVVSGNEKILRIPYHGLTAGDCFRLVSRNTARWSWGGGAIFDGQLLPGHSASGYFDNITIPANITPGDYEFDLMVGFSYGGTICFSDAQPLRVKIVPSGGNKMMKICSGQQVVYTPECITAGMSGAENYHWSRETVNGIKENATTGVGGISEVLTNETTEPIEVTYVYLVQANTCSEETSYKLIVTVMPVIRFKIVNSTPEICSGQTTNIALSPETLNYHWVIEGEDKTGEGNAIVETLHCEELPTTYTYRITPKNGECSEDQTTSVKVNPLPEIYLTSQLLGRQKRRFSQRMEFIAEPANYNEYTFVFNGEKKVQQENVFYSRDWLEDKNNLLKVSVASPEGCESSDSLTFIGPNWELPNAITPNGDGINDRLLPGYELEVFNRNGSQLYKGKDGWDGRYRGEKVEAGTYLYVVRLEQEDGTVIVKKYYVFVK